MNTLQSSTDNFTLRFSSKVHNAYSRYCKIHTAEITKSDASFDKLLQAARDLLVYKTGKMVVNGVYRVVVFSQNCGNMVGSKEKVKAACLILRVQLTSKNSAKIVDDTKDNEYMKYLVHIVTIPNGKEYKDFIKTDGIVAKKHQITRLFDGNAPFAGPNSRVKLLDEQLTTLVKNMAEITL